MGDSTTLALLIEDGNYGFDLKQLLMKQQYEQPEHKEILSVILKLIKVDLRNCEANDLKANFTNAELQLICENLDAIAQVENKEIKARWYDALLTLNKKHIREYISVVRQDYLHVYSAVSNIDYLIRAVALVKYAKSIFKNRLEEIFDEVKKELYKCNSSYYQQLVLIELISIYGHTKCQLSFNAFFEDKIRHFLLVKDFRSARFCIKSQHLTGIIDGNQCNIRMAENYEAEGDQYVSEKEPNTYYPSISAIYLKGFRLITSAQGCAELHERLERKVEDTQLDDFRMVQAAGVPINPKVDLEAVHRTVLEMNLDNSSQAYHTLLALPIIPKSAVDEMAEAGKASNPTWASFFSEQVKLSKKGAQIAAQDIADSYASNSRTYLREKLMACIYFIKNKLDGHIEMNQTMVTKILVDAKSPFVPEERLYNYSLGLTAGFQNDFVTAAHLLVPQLENSLRHLAVTNGIIVTTYEKRFQLENLLGGLITKLRPIANEDIMDELNSFLVDNNNVNFRNELLHGLIETTLVQKYGQYVWWLCLKLIIQTKIIFPGAA